MKLFYLISLCFLFLLYSCTPQEEITRIVHKLPEGIQAPSDAVIYSLPRTAIMVKVEVEKEIQKKGPFYAYRNKYLGQDGGIADDLTIWRSADSDISSYVEVDPVQF